MANKAGREFGGAFYGVPKAVTWRRVAGRHSCVIANTGRYAVRGTTAIAGTPNFPTSASVWLLRMADRQVIHTTQSSTDGVYEFLYVPAGTYSVIAWDATGTFNAVVAENVSAEPVRSVAA
ncbi:MAG: hypothetical protein ACPGPF_00045 [Pontibacterium sp.]